MTRVALEEANDPCGRGGDANEPSGRGGRTIRAPVGANDPSGGPYEFTPARAGGLEVHP
jgi:hypothetical protein